MSAPRALREGDLAGLVTLLGDDKVVGVPTDTVYGLAARLTEAATQRIFVAKGRPQALALPVLIGAPEQLAAVAAVFEDEAVALAARFWPGALTIVVPARPEIARIVGGDGGGVGVRLPDHAPLQALLRAAGPLAVTSANRHGDPPCTTAEELRAAFSGAQVAAVLDGGPCQGLVSTVVDLCGVTPRCLREGEVDWEEVVDVLA
ncbi:MAG: L-threonylcarbamoyladenylate synthase [Acidimicrobiales bacterium]